MEKLTNIMAAIDQPASALVVLEKAVALAREFDAHLELLIVDPAIDVGQLSRCAALAPAQLSVRTLPRAAAPLHARLLREVKDRRPDLLIKAPAGVHPLRRWSLTANDWRLSQQCPVPLLLAGAKPWDHPLRIAAAVDVTDVCSLSVARGVLHAAGFLALGCRGNLDVLYTEREQDDEVLRMERAVRLAQLIREYHVGCERLQMFEGAPETRLPPLIAARQYDLLALGALSHRRGIGQAIRSLTSQLAEATSGDLLIVKGEPDGQPLVAGHVPSTAKKIPDQCQQFV
jgi:nucleotide-binding universal stress UspA family protein